MVREMKVRNAAKLTWKSKKKLMAGEKQCRMRTMRPAADLNRGSANLVTHTFGENMVTNYSGGLYEVFHPMKKYFYMAKFIFSTKIVSRKRVVSHKRINNSTKTL